MSTTAVRVTLLVESQRRYPYYRATLLGPRSRAPVGTLEVPIVLTIDDQLLEQRTKTIALTVDAPAVSGEVQR